MRDASKRVITTFSSLEASTLSSILLFAGKVSAETQGGYIGLNSSSPTYYGFEAGTVDINTTGGQKVYADIDNFFHRTLNLTANQHRSWEIRKSGNVEQCLGNLSMALEGVGAAYQAGAAGATTLLTLLPTAGALIGAPAKELWVLYKLVPIAGFLSMMLSLGGNIVPSDITAYERIDTLSYSGMIGTRVDQKSTFPSVKASVGNTEADIFADEVHARAINYRRARKTGAIVGGIILQLVWLGFIIFAAWFAQNGGVVVWMCTIYPWMFIWYICVATSSLLENIAGVPFTKQWTVRVSRAPKVNISDDTPFLLAPQIDAQHDFEMQPLSRDLSPGSSSVSPSMTRRDTLTSFATPASSTDAKLIPSADDIAIQTRPLLASSAPSASCVHHQPARVPHDNTRPATDILTRLEHGIATRGQIAIDANEPWSAGTDTLYVIISVTGTSHMHATLRVFSKFFAIGVFTFGTALFASTTLITILTSMTTATLILLAGAMGRVTAMWMASQIMESKPVVHRVVQHRNEAERYVAALLRRKGLACEILGHIIVDGRVVKKFGRRMRRSTILGVLAPPYDLRRCAVGREQV